MAVSPLNINVPIVDPNGRPTPEFIRWITDQTAVNATIPNLGSQQAVSVVLDKIGADHGAVLYRAASLWSALAASTSGYALTTAGAGADPVWREPTFLWLTDTPSDYTGQGGKYVRVNAGADALEFVTLALSFLGLSDTPSDYTGQTGKVPAVNAAEDGLEFIDAGGGGSAITIETVTAGTYSLVQADLDGGKYKRVNAAGGCEVTVTAGLTVDQPVEWFQVDGSITFTPDTGVTLNYLGDYASTGGAGSWARLVPVAANEYDLHGDLAAPVTVTVATHFPTFATVAAVAGWGTALRNPAYTGPALRVRNTSTGDETDVNFDSNGFVNTLPYGSNTRVIKLYDQWGTEDLSHTSPTNSDVQLALKAGDNGYHLKGGGVYQRFVTPSVVSAAPAWKVNDPLYFYTMERDSAAGLQTTALVTASGTGYATCGVFANGSAWAWRVDGGSNVNWPSTTYVAGTRESVFADYTQKDGNAYGYVNNTLKVTTAGGNPLSYSDTSSPLYFMDETTFTEYDGKMFEVHVFDRTAGLSSADRTLLQTASEIFNSPLAPTSFIQLESSTDRIELEDGSGVIGLE